MVRAQAPFRLVAWNIRAGGGARAGKIAAALTDMAPDLVVLSEFRSTPASQHIASELAAAGLSSQICTTRQVPSGANALLIAARSALARVGLRQAPREPGRWAMARLAAPRLAVGAMHIPNQHTGRKPFYHDAVADLAKRWRGGPALLVGDTNSGRIGEDEETAVFNQRTHAWFDRLAAAGWRDGFRLKHGAKREFTWFSPGHDNGFRLDQVFLNPALAARLKDVRHTWPPDPAQPGRRDGLSDHAALVVEMQLS
ncbi:MAG: endonuclease/exonuclease/phosphatase family protein [Pseudomonadota bacterium]